MVSLMEQHHRFWLLGPEGIGVIGVALVARQRAD